MSKFISSINEQEQLILKEYQANREQIACDIRSLVESLDSFSIPPSHCDLFSANNLCVTASRVMPNNIRIGYKEVNLNDGHDPIGMPLTLDLQNTNAVLFEFEGNNTSLLQQIGFRLLMSLKPGLCQLHLVDANYGKSFRQLSYIKHPQIKIENIYSSMDVEQLIKELGAIIVEANHTYRASFANLNAYNSREEKNPQPYHVVLIDNFPENFNDTSIEDLGRLINNRNAINAGIYIFINGNGANSISFNRHRTRQLDIDAIREVCTRISYDQAKSITIDGIAIPDGSKAKLDFGNISITDQVQHLLSGYKVEKINTQVLDQWIEDLKQSDKVWKTSTSKGIEVPVGIKDRNEQFVFHIFMICASLN